MKTSNLLTDEKFQTIYTDPAFRNAVAYAHQCCEAGGQFKHFETCTYPERYIPTPEQIEIAKTEIARHKAELLNAYKNVLVFVGMGSTYEARYPDDVCQHRMRTEFLNAEGHKYFIEFGTGRKNELRIDFAIDRDLEEVYRKSNDNGQPYYNFKGLERNTPALDYTLDSVLKIVNEYFNCDFQTVVVDNFTLSPDDVLCESPMYTALY